MAKHNNDASGRNAQSRARIAEGAARYILEHGIQDYSLAKKKAARQLGLPEGSCLPSNEEIEQAILDRQSLFEPEEHAKLLLQLRQQALEVMQAFERFAPVLTGSVASGAISEHSLIELELRPEDSKDFEHYLINQHIEYKIQDRSGRMSFLVYAQPADVLVRLPERETSQGHSGRRIHLTLKQLSALVMNEGSKPG